jgi:hypothetical protein
MRRALGAALFVLLLSVAGMKNALAQTQIATLKHGDDISVFYGINALVSAHNAATIGDVITLSEGSFNCCNITKAITLHGAGCHADTVAHTFGTTVPGDFYLEVPTNDTAFLTIEGVSFPGRVKYKSLFNPRFIRCIFNNIDYSNSNYYMTNAQFINCIIQEMEYFVVNNTLFINSVIYKAKCSHSTYSNTGEIYYNSIVRYWNEMQNAVAYNSIIVCGNTSVSPPNSGSTFYNCIGIMNGQSANMFQYQTNATNLLLNTYSDVFDTWDGTFSFEEDYVLKESIISAFQGNDGTEVGIHGGSLPYDPRPSYMVVKRYNVANKSTHDGKLSVEIELIPEDE